MVTIIIYKLMSNKDFRSSLILILLFFSSIFCCEEALLLFLTWILAGWNEKDGSFTSGPCEIVCEFVLRGSVFLGGGG